MKKWIILLLFLSLFFSQNSAVFAQTITPTPEIPTETTPVPGDGSNQVTNAYTLDPPFESIDDAVDKVKITFNNIDLAGDVFVCMEGDLCIDSDNIRDGIADGKEDSFAKAREGMKLDDVDEGTIQRYKLGPDHSIVFCGDGDTKLKADGTKESHPYYAGKNNDNKWWGLLDERRGAGCVKGKDYFYPGKSYILGLYTVSPDDNGKPLWALHDVAGIYINHHPPSLMAFDHVNYLSPNTESFTVSLAADKNKPYGRVGTKSILYQQIKNLDKFLLNTRNNYQVTIKASGYQESRCGTLLEGSPKDITFTPPKDKLQQGKLTVTIRDQINETSEISNALYKALEFDDDVIQRAALISKLAYGQEITASTICQGGFTYRVYNCQVSKDININNCKTYSAPDPKDPTKKVTHPYIDDPDHADIKGLLSYFDKLGGNAAITSLPCNIGSNTQKNPSKCKELNTAIGKIPVDPVGFITKIFSIVLSIAGLGAMITIILAGYRMMISRGNPEALKGARERLTSAIVGLLFIIFSLVILSVITQDILKIPGFG